MRVAELVRLLQACDPDAVVVIPRDRGITHDTETVCDVARIAASHFSVGPAAIFGVVQLSSFPAVVLLGLSGLGEETPSL
jgi:hypothetical protein